MKKNYLTTSFIQGKFKKNRFIFSILFLSFFVSFNYSLKAQTAVTAIHTTTQSAIPSFYVEGGTTYNWGQGNDLFLVDVVVGGNTFAYETNISPIRFEFIRVDAGHVSTGFRNRLMSERSAANTYNATYPAANANGSRMEVALQEPILNRGALDVFHNVDPVPLSSSSQHSNNIERIDILYNPFPAPALLNEIGFLVSEKNGNNGIKIAVVTAVDPVTGDPTAYGSLVTIDTGDYGEVNAPLDWGFVENNITPPHGNPVEIRISNERYGISLVTFNQLGITAGQVVHGISVFGIDVTGAHNLLDPTTFPANTNEGADIHGGLGSIVKTNNINFLPLAENDNISIIEGVLNISGDLFADNGNGVDDLGITPTTVTSFDAISTHGGTVSVNPDGTYTYTPLVGFSGYDTFTYTITDVNGNTSTAIVTIDVQSDNDEDGIPDTVDLDDDNDGILDEDENVICNGPTLEHILINDDFGTGNRTLTSFTNYIYEDGTGSGGTGGSVNDGQYVIVQFARPYHINTGAGSYSAWTTVADHTGNANGRMAVFNAAVASGEFYNRPISNLIANVDVDISFWILNVITSGGLILPNITLEIRDASNTVVFTSNTGNIAEDETWNNYSVTFNPGNNTDLRFVLINSAGGGVGNDLALDDIKLSQVVCDTDGDTVPNHLDLDSDNDGIPDVTEAGGIDAGNGTIAGFVDGDNDGLDDTTATTPLTIPNTDSDTGDLLPNFLDLDSDADGIPDVIEAGGIDADGDAHVDYGTPGDPATMTDVNNNGLLDALETTPLPIPNTDGTGNPNYIDIDADDDGIVDNIEAQTTADYNPPRVNAGVSMDSDGDGLNDEYDGDDNTIAGIGGGTSNALVPTNTDGTDDPDYIDTDSDNDGDLDTLEAYDTDNDGVADTVPANADFDDDGLDDNFDDNDAVLDPTNNGQLPTFFPDLDIPGGDRDWRQALDIDWDNDGVNDAADLDSDNDGIPDIIESGGIDPYTDNDLDGVPAYLDGDDNDNAVGDTGVQPAFDADGDGVPNYLDLDSDNDGIYDIVESGQIDPANNIVDIDNDGVIDAANSGTVGTNGLFDPLETTPDSNTLANLTADSDGNGTPDSLELNSDGDGCSDVLEAGFSDGDLNGLLGNGTFGAGLTVDLNGVVNTSGLTDGYTTPNDLDNTNDLANNNPGYDFQEFGEAVTIGVTIPTDQTVILNADANFDVSLGSGVNPTYEWFESTNGVDFFPITNGGIYTGANTATLVVNANSLALSGNEYYVTLSAPGYACDGSVSSLPVTLTVVNDFDGDGISDDIDLDDDNDGIPDSVEGTGDFDNDGTPNHHDLDSDNDGVFDTNEAGFADLDPNNDGIIDGDNTSFGTNGLSDAVETAPDSNTINYIILNTDGDGQPNFLDVDDDGDGINTKFENPSSDGDKDPADAQDSDNDLIPDYLDVDDDNDGVNTEFEVSNADGDGDPNTGVAILNTDGDLFPNYLDIDDDGDGVNTVFENPNPDNDGNPNTGATQDTDNDTIPDYLDTDDDGDSILTIFENPNPDNDGNPNTGATQDSDNDLIPDYLDVDDDNDGVYTIFENPDPNQDGNPNDAQNIDGDLFPDYLDVDDDGDGINTEDENPDPNNDGNPSDAQDIDGDGTPDYLDIDDDNDGIPTIDELVYGDTDGDGLPNYLDIDDDGDGILTIIEGQADIDSDGHPNYLDQDADGDGLGDNVEGQLTATYVLPSGDSDGNGLDDSYESVPGAKEGISVVDTDGDTTPDYLDTDSDNDWVPDSIEAFDTDHRGTANVTPSGADIDGDGFDDAFDASVGDFLAPNGKNGKDDIISNPQTDLPNTDNDLKTNYSNVTPDLEVDYRDTDDDGDGLLTTIEDGNQDGDPTNDDCDFDFTPDYLDPTPCDIVPSGFSPNGDGVNDTLVIPILKQYPNFTMQVYNRWGNEVYSYKNAGSTNPEWWNGFSTGNLTIGGDNKVPAGTYFYIIHFNDGTEKPRNGWVYVNY